MGLHVATALALLVYFWRDWVRIIGGFLTSIRDRRIETADQRLAWLIILGTIPVGIAGLLLEHTLRTLLGKPIPAAIFLTINGVILYAGERLRRKASRRADEEVVAEVAELEEVTAVRGSARRRAPRAAPAGGGARPGLGPAARRCRFRLGRAGVTVLRAWSSNPLLS